MENLKSNKLYEILTPDGWKDFSGVLKTKHTSYLRIEFEDGSNILCSLTHRIKCNNRFIESHHLKIDDVIENKKIIWIDKIEEEIELYDPVNVGDRHEYIGNGIINHNCVEFIGSAGTLISSFALKNLVYINALKTLLEHKLKVYEEPIADHQYVLVADSSHGKELDYSAFVIFDVMSAPYKIVATFRDNNVAAQAYPNIISAIGKHYNNAYVLGENNDIGALVLQILTQDLDYPNVFYTEDIKGNQGLTFRGGKTPGLKTTKKTKRQGCNALKTLVENDQMIVNDFETGSELTTFVIRPNGTYAADNDCNDDLAMCLVLFAWLTTQQAFKELTDSDMRKKLFDEQARLIEEELPPPPVIIKADTKPDTILEDGIVWEVSTNISDSDYDLWSGYSDPKSMPRGW